MRLNYGWKMFLTIILEQTLWAQTPLLCFKTAQQSERKKLPIIKQS